MQRSTGPGGNLWTTADIGLGSAGNNFSGQTNRNMTNPASTMKNLESLSVYGYALTQSQTPGALHFKPNWGQSEPDILKQQSTSAALWKSDSTVHGSSSDQTRSFLGTEQWGRESGGAPWGSTGTEASTTSETSCTTDQTMFSHHATDATWMPSRTSPMYQNESTQDALETLPKKSSVEVDNENSNNDNAESSPTSNSLNQSPVEEENRAFEKLQNAPGTQTQESENVISENNPEKSEVVTSTASPSENVPTPGSQQGVRSTGSHDSEQGQIPNAENNVGATIDQLQQLNLMDSYVAQQQNIAAQLTSYQLAMHQQYALAAQQQQQLAAPGMFLPSSYIIPAQGSAPAGYGDPNSAGQFPMMTQYPYASWPATAGIYPMLQQQMAAVAASVSSQQVSSSTAQPTRVSTQTPQSPPPQSSSSQQQEGTQTQSDILTNMAAVQHSNLNQAMALAAGYSMIPGYYDQSGALIINNGRGTGPVRLITPGPIFMNGSQHLMPPQMGGGNGSMLRYNQNAQQQAAANALYANQQNVSGGSTPVPSVNQAFNPVIPHGSSSTINSLGIGTLGTGIESSNSTPQRRDSFSDYPNHHPSHSGMSQFYNSLGVTPGGSGLGMSTMSPSPGPLGNMMTHNHHGLNSPPPSMSSPNLMLGSSNRIFSAAPGAETKFRNGPYVSSSIYGNSGSSLFPPTRIRPPKDMMMQAGRSKLLDDFRNNRLSNPLLPELTNHIVEFSQDQHGSRFIQQKLERASPGEKQQVFNEIVGSAYQLMTDVFGNYVIQKFFEFGSMEHKLALADCIRGRVLPLALQMYGCRVIQKALECIPQEQQVEIVKELDGHLLQCVKDQNGNHVVQKCIECVPPVNLQFIVNGFKGQVVGLSSHPYGCRVMQRILEHCTDEQTAPILEELHQCDIGNHILKCSFGRRLCLVFFDKHTEMLVTDQYGNYVIQHILEHGRPEHKSQMVNELRGKILNLSQHKFASNVVEKCVSHSSHQNRAWLIEEICQEPDALFMMMKDPYANYVVQKMLDVAEPQQKKLLVNKIRPHVQTLRKFTYGKHMMTKLEKFFLRSVSNTNPGSTSSTADLSGSQIPSSNWTLDNAE